MANPKTLAIEGIFEDARYSSFKTLGRRVFASLFDTTLVSLVGALAMVPVVASGSRDGVVALFFAQLVGTFAYAILMNFFCGGTLGKLLFQLKLVDNGTLGKIRFRQALRRELINLLFASVGVFLYLWCLSAIPPGNLQVLLQPASAPLNSWNDLVSFIGLNPLLSLYFGFEFAELGGEFLVALANRKRRAIHDYIASTAVLLTSDRYRRFSRLACLSLVFLNATLVPFVRGTP